MAGGPSTPRPPNGLEVQLPGGIGGKASGGTVIVLLGFIVMASALVFQGFILRDAIRDQTTHFDDKVRDMTHEIERSCGPAVLIPRREK